MSEAPKPPTREELVERFLRSMQNFCVDIGMPERDCSVKKVRKKLKQIKKLEATRQ